MPTHIGISMCRPICQHFGVSTYISASEYVGMFVITRKWVDIDVGIFLTTSRMCRHLDVSTYMSASWCVDIYVSILMCRHICQHLDVSTYMSASKWVGIFVNIRKMCWYMSAYFWPLVVDCVGISMCWYMCRHLNVSTCVWASEYVSIFVSRKSNTRKKCVDIYVGIFRTTNKMYWRLDLSTFVSTYKCQLGCDVDLELDGRIAVNFCKRSWRELYVLLCN